MEHQLLASTEKRKKDWIRSFVVQGLTVDKGARVIDEGAGGP